MLVDRVNLREATVGDEEDLWRVHVAALEATVAPEDLKSSIAEFCPEPLEDVTALKDCIVVVADLDGQVVGFSGLNVATGWVFFMFVAPQFMRHGIGRRLLSRLERIAAERGLRELTLSSSLYAHRFYKACGFVGDEPVTEAGRRTGLRSQAYIMRKAL